MAIFQILNGKCHWKTPFKSLDEVFDRFPPDCIFVEAPDYVNEQWGFDDTEIGDDRFIKPVPPDGWSYDDETGQMMPDEMLAEAIEQTKTRKQAENNEIFAMWLKQHPLTWTDGKQYGVTLEDQQEIALNLTSYEMETRAVLSQLPDDATEETMAAALATVRLEWHAIHEACVPWTAEELTALSLAIRQYIYPAYNLNQTYKTAIFAATTRKEIADIELDYSSLSPEDEEETEGDAPAEEDPAPVEE